MASTFVTKLVTYLKDAGFVASTVAGDAPVLLSDFTKLAAVVATIKTILANPLVAVSDFQTLQKSVADIESFISKVESGLNSASTTQPKTGA